MKKRFSTHSALLILRFGGMGGRFLFIFALPTKISIGDIGIFGALNAFVWFAILIAGFDIYSVFFRHALLSSFLVLNPLLKAYVAIIGMVATLIIPITFLVFTVYTHLPWLALSIGLIVSLEYLTQEGVRFSALLARPKHGALSAATKQGGWPLGLLAVDLLLPGTLSWNLDLILAAWIIGDLLALFVLIPLLWPYMNFPRNISRHVNLSCLAAMRSWRLFLSTISVIFLDLGCRFLAIAFGTSEQVGLVTLMASFSTLSLLSVRSVVEPIYYPQVIAGVGGAEKGFRRSVVLVAASVSVVAFVAGCSYFWFLGMMHQTREYILFGCLCASYFIIAAATVPRMLLFARHRDKENLRAALLASVMFVVFGTMIGQIGTIEGVAAASIAGAVTLYGLSAWSSIQIFFPLPPNCSFSRNGSENEDA